MNDTIRIYGEPYQVKRITISKKSERGPFVVYVQPTPETAIRTRHPWAVV